MFVYVFVEHLLKIENFVKMKGGLWIVDLFQTIDVHALEFFILCDPSATIFYLFNKKIAILLCEKLELVDLLCLFLHNSKRILDCAILGGFEEFGGYESGVVLKYFWMKRSVTGQENM